MDITGILSALIIGLVIGVLAKLIVPGRQKVYTRFELSTSA